MREKLPCQGRKRWGGWGCARREAESTWAPPPHRSRSPHRRARHGSELAAEGLVQEGLLQLLQGGEFAFVEAGEVLSFRMYAVNLLKDL